MKFAYPIENIFKHFNYQTRVTKFVLKEILSNLLAKLRNERTLEKNCESDYFIVVLYTTTSNHRYNHVDRRAKESQPNSMFYSKKIEPIQLVPCE